MLLVWFNYVAAYYASTTKIWWMLKNVAPVFMGIFIQGGLCFSDDTHNTG